MGFARSSNSYRTVERTTWITLEYQHSHHKSMSYSQLCYSEIDRLRKVSPANLCPT